MNIFGESIEQKLGAGRSYDDKGSALHLQAIIPFHTLKRALLCASNRYYLCCSTKASLHVIKEVLFIFYSNLN